ncbi:MAG: winged helix-turn-helix domain-containing protein [Planctomycetes bacterium]|nr:winged helix-turn-helix domain-containing protein [Planctomycetota bacterium]
MAPEIASIGENAGQIWRYLSENGKASPSELAKALKTNVVSVHRAIGWLAREDKLSILRVKGVEHISLNAGV